MLQTWNPERFIQENYKMKRKELRNSTSLYSSLVKKKTCSLIVWSNL